MAAGSTRRAAALITSLRHDFRRIVIGISCNDSIIDDLQTTALHSSLDPSLSDVASLYEERTRAAARARSRFLPSSASIRRRRADDGGSSKINARRAERGERGETVASVSRC